MWMIFLVLALVPLAHAHTSAGPVAQTIAAGNTIAADACGTYKYVTAASAVTTDTTDTFTAPAAGNAGCRMTVCNAGANTITLDTNAHFLTTTGLDLSLLPTVGCVLVHSDGTTWIQDTVASTGTSGGAGPGAQTIAGGGTIAADACGTYKYITAAGVVTTDTTNTFTTPSVTNAGCRMIVCNVSANEITLDANGNFKTAGGANVVLTDAYDCVTVHSDGGSWVQDTAVINNS